MSLLQDTWTAFQGNEGWLRVRQHIVLSLVPLAAATVIGLVLGIAAAKTSRIASFSIQAIAFIGRMIPTFAAMALIMSATSIGFRPAVGGLILLALPTILLGTLTGIREVDPAAVDAARGMGFTPRQVLMRVELPLALPYIMNGIRIASVMVIATAALAGTIGADGLGVTILAGFSNGQDAVLLAGAIPVTLLALIAEGGFLLLGRTLTPTGLRRGARRKGTAHET